ncbi:aminotransferase class I/II-fold pyridoxal phosphate-dependent enzyme [Butyrivibrio sp. AE3004]|uniref:aminotransferase class I/II-fold pyridoxal phosphate-dependent enzyme n=1 Tax=Butyrivibrio sp. AE3004 TaxID=1506994 RepID=UPI000493CE31|nr:hypothetical protein [Butyrivibrio sp. AE3004]
MESLKKELEKLNRSKLYPFHMPGHKRNPCAGSMAGYMDIDITEIDGFDNLHDAEGILLDIEKKASRLYGVGETHLLVNGSTSGILAAISAAIPAGGKLLAGRNSHKALYHAAYIRRLELSYLKPVMLRLDNTSFVWGGIDPECVKAELEKDNSIEAVFITSPTYDGICSNIREISEVCHRFSIPLIVDAAHGAHFGLFKDLPENAITQCADIIIHSVHKTLASMTQTALIHVQGNLINREMLRRFLRIYQSSSPSYVLMSSIDSCINDILDRGDEIFGRLIEYKKRILRETINCNYLFIPGEDCIKDPCKVLVFVRNRAITGQQIYDILRLDYDLQPEMAGDDYVLLIITGYDSDDGIDRLIKAINEIDNKLNFKINNKDVNNSTSENICKEFTVSDNYPKALLPIYKAWDSTREELDISLATGRISGEFVNLYPPGIPLIVPGEVFTKELINSIGHYINDGRNIQGVNILQNGERKVSIVLPDR